VPRNVAHGEPLEPPPVSPARGPPTDWADLVQVHDDRDTFQASPDELTAIDIRSPLTAAGRQVTTKPLSRLEKTIHGLPSQRDGQSASRPLNALFIGQ
jgi:hypothetical protein